MFMVSFASRTRAFRNGLAETGLLFDGETSQDNSLETLAEQNPEPVIQESTTGGVSAPRQDCIMHRRSQRRSAGALLNKCTRCFVVRLRIVIERPQYGIDS